MISIWCHDVDDKTYTAGGMRPIDDYIGIALSQGKRMLSSFPRNAKAMIEFEGRHPTDFFFAGPYPIVSEQIVNVLNQHHVNAEYIPLRLFDRKKKKITGEWYCWNILATVDCFDWEASRYTQEREFATKIRKLVIDERKVTTEPLFIVARTITPVIAVHQPLVDDLIDCGCTGVRFAFPDKWRNPAYP